uniref:Uncharacterized protein n=1 Tax=Pyxicephalus adspersus TaxID=30357 RepID=A0AAV2ZT61_PYXAD|nr:TPA: hypothetical protein GDO54_002619 [Pyxicephalus adspersus]
MAFTFAAFCYMLTLVLCASLIFFIIWHHATPFYWSYIVFYCILIVFVNWLYPFNSVFFFLISWFVHNPLFFSFLTL